MPTMMLSLMSSLEKVGAEFLNKQLVSVSCCEDRKLLPIDDAPHTSLMTVIRNCFIEPDVSHRIALYNAHGEIVDVVSQLDVLAFLYKSVSSMSFLDSSMDKSLAELGFLQKTRPVVSVNAHEPMLHALSKMAKEEVSSAPVVVNSGSIIANLSLSDLRALRSEHFGVLALPCAEYLALLHQTAYIGYSRSSSEHGSHPYFASQGSSHAPKPDDIQVYAILGSTSLLDTIRTLCEHRLHHLYVVDENPDDETAGAVRVQAVISITDILQFIAGVF
jgi:CBS domain-containing protein